MIKIYTLLFSLKSKDISENTFLLQKVFNTSNSQCYTIKAERMNEPEMQEVYDCHSKQKEVI